MRTLKLTIAYEGTRYAGWQVQPGCRSIQGVLQEAVRNLTGRAHAIVAAGRTDAGVHALGQVAHMRTASPIPCQGFVQALNARLPEDIAILDIEERPASFHAQRDALGKLYRYRILISRVPQPMMQGRAWSVEGRLDLKAMREAASHLIGLHDFSSFQASGCAARHARRRVTKIQIADRSRSHECWLCPGEARIIDIDVEGEGFLRHMIRNIVGTLVEIGQGRREPREMHAILTARKRKEAGRCAPASGLYLVKVFY